MMQIANKRNLLLALDMSWNELQRVLLRHTDLIPIQTDLAYLVAWHRAVINLIHRRKIYTGLRIAKMVYETHDDSTIESAIQQAYTTESANTLIEQLSIAHHELVDLIKAMSERKIQRGYPVYLSKQFTEQDKPTLFQVVYVLVYERILARLTQLEVQKDQP